MMHGRRTAHCHVTPTHPQAILIPAAALFAKQVGVDFYALSFVRDAAVIYELKRFLAEQGGRLMAAVCMPPPSPDSAAPRTLAPHSLPPLPSLLPVPTHTHLHY
jgi:hypothetical protein